MKSLTQQLKRFSDDERAVSPVVGFVLIFALIMIVFTIYQSSVVPAQNEQVEFKHSQIVEGQMSELNDAIQQAGASGVPQSVTIDTGVQYPDRALAINPGSPVGTLNTGDPQTVTVSGLSDGSGYWSGGRTFETQPVSYRPSYNLLQQRTKYTLENGMIVKDFENNNPPMPGSDVGMFSKDGQQINLVLIEGAPQTSGVTTSLTAKPVSTSTEYLHLEADDGGKITVPTTLSEATWRNEIVDSAKQINSVTVAGGKATLNLKKGHEYALRISKVTLGGSDSSALTYLKSESPQDPSQTIEASVGESKTFTVSAHDEFGNPYSGATVTATTDGAGILTPTSGTKTNENGRATFSYKPADTDTTTVEVTLRLDGGSADTVTLPGGTDKQLNTVTYRLTIPDNSGSSDNSNDIGGDIDNGYALPTSRRVTIDSATASGNSVDFKFNNRGDTDMTVTRIQFSGYVGHFPSSSFATSGTFADTTIELNGQTVTLNTPFTVGANEPTPTTATLSDLDVNKVQTGLLIVSVEYQYIEDGTTKTDTATYSIPVLK